MNKCNVVIPTIGKNNMIISLLNQLNKLSNGVIRNIYVFDNGMPRQTLDKCFEIPNISIVNAANKGIYKMWNDGVKLSLQENDQDYIAIFNDDLNLLDRPDWFQNFFIPFQHDDVWATCANYSYKSDDTVGFKDVVGTFKDNGFAGFCFAVKGSAYLSGLPLFDERYEWWYGDDDFVHSVHKAGKRTTISLNAAINHINGGSQSTNQYTPEFNAKVEKDRNLYYAKWHRVGV